MTRTSWRPRGIAARVSLLAILVTAVALGIIETFENDCHGAFSNRPTFCFSGQASLTLRVDVMTSLTLRVDVSCMPTRSVSEDSADIAGEINGAD